MTTILVSSVHLRTASFKESHLIETKQFPRVPPLSGLPLIKHEPLTESCMSEAKQTTIVPIDDRVDDVRESTRTHLRLKPKLPSI
jgi:hypothetical protein